MKVMEDVQSRSIRKLCDAARSSITKRKGGSTEQSNPESQNSSYACTEML
jgi:hypothetical protein